MKLERIEAGARAVQALVGQGFRVGGRDYGGGVRISEEAVEPWAAASLAEVGADALPQGEYDLVILGTGPALRRPPPALAEAAARRGIAVEAMDSRAAARTFNMLLAEGRRVAAALLPL